MDNNTSVCNEYTSTIGERIYIYAWYGTKDWIGMRMTGPVAVCGND